MNHHKINIQQNLLQHKNTMELREKHENMEIKVTQQFRDKNIFYLP